MALYVIGITGNDINRNKRLGVHLQNFLDQSYKEFYKTPNYRKYLQVFIETFHHSLEKTVTFIQDISHHRKLNISKQVLTEQLNILGNGILWDEVLASKLLEFEDISKKRPTYDFYVIVPDIVTVHQLEVVRRFNADIIFNFESVKPVDKMDFWSYKMLNWKRVFVKGSRSICLESCFGENDIWYHHNKPEHYMKEFAKALVTDFNNDRIYHNKNVKG